MSKILSKTFKTFENVPKYQKQPNHQNTAIWKDNLDRDVVRKNRQITVLRFCDEFCWCFWKISTKYWTLKYQIWCRFNRKKSISIRPIICSLSAPADFDTTLMILWYFGPLRKMKVQTETIHTRRWAARRRMAVAEECEASDISEDERDLAVSAITQKRGDR